MNIESIASRPTVELANGLEEFESQFRYPLGPNAWFRISHGEDYTRFFRSIGNARCFVASDNGQVAGVISAMICRLRRPGQEFQRCGYLSDLKVAKSVSGRTLLRLLRAANDWVLTEPTPGFCVVMDGTTRDPTTYTGRLGISEFRVLGHLTILRIPGIDVDMDSACFEHPINDVKSRHRELTAQKFATDGGNISLRSEISPIGLMTTDKNACGILEDTRRGKRLFDQHGQEMVSGHLSCFGYSDASTASNLIQGALQRCRQVKLPSLFVAVPTSETKSIVSHLGIAGIVEAPATVFGYDLDVHELKEQGTWSINTAEI